MGADGAGTLETVFDGLQRALVSYDSTQNQILRVSWNKDGAS